MMSARLRAIVQGGCCLVASAAVGGDRLSVEEVPVPDDASVRMVARDLVQHGLPVQIASLETSRSREATLEFYRDAWPADEDGPGHLESQAGEWVIISHLLDEQNIVVQLRDDAGGTAGLISVMSLQPLETPAAVDRPLPPGGERLSTTTTVDIGTSATTSVIESPERAGLVSAFYKDVLAREGWSLVSERVVSGQIVLMLQQAGAWIELVVSDEFSEGSVVVLNEVRLDA